VTEYIGLLLYSRCEQPIVVVPEPPVVLPGGEVGAHGVSALLPQDLLDQGRLRHMHGEDAPEARLPHGAVALQALQLEEDRDRTGRDVKSG